MINRIKSNFSNQNLSGGEKQVVALLRALCSEKKILLLDEPFAAMNKATIDEFVKNLENIDRMVVIIAHNINEHVDKFSRVYNMVAGDLINQKCC